MIRRLVDDEFWLIAQDDHAKISGLLAEQFGNDTFARPSARAIRAIALHDCGWPTHDDRPTLNARRLPLDVFETPRAIGLAVWSTSSERAATEDPYAGLLVSLHGLALSILATTASPFAHERFDTADPRGRFEVNQFQHAQIELQERLRKTLGMRIDQPLRHGLAEGSDDPVEQQLAFDFRLLQAMDKLSLAICCTKPPAMVIEPVIHIPGGAAVALRVRTADNATLVVEPWPFQVDRIEVSVPFRRMSSGPSGDDDAFRLAYQHCPVEEFTVGIAPAGP